MSGNATSDWGVETFSALLGIASIGIFETSIDGRVLRANDACARLLSYGDSEDLRQSIVDVARDLYVNPEDRRRFIDTLATKGQVNNFVVPMRRNTDGEVWCSMSARAVREHGDGIDRVLGVVVDVSELVMAREALAEAEQRYRHIVETASEGIYQSTLDGDILTANPAFIRDIAGYDSLEQLRSELTDVARQFYVDPDQRRRLAAELEKRDRVENLVTQVRRRDGSIIWVSENSRVVRRADGSPRCYEGSVIDITDRIKADEAMRQAVRDAEQANRAKSEFLANMSHELRTPLNAILGFTEIMIHESFGPVGNARYRGYLKDIHDSASLQLQLIEDILDICKSEAGKLQLSEKRVDLAGVARASSRLLRERAARRKVKMRVEIPADLPEIVADERRLRQIAINLLSNAIKFTEEGEVRLELRQNQDGDIEMCVADTGLGMTESEIKRALQPFEQLHGQSEYGMEGTGLGLPLVKTLVEMHDGVLDITSRPGEGTTVVARFPAKRVLS